MEGEHSLLLKVDVDKEEKDSYQIGFEDNLLSDGDGESQLIL